MGAQAQPLTKTNPSPMPVDLSVCAESNKNGCLRSRLQCAAAVQQCFVNYGEGKQLLRQELILQQHRQTKALEVHIYCVHEATMDCTTATHRLATVAQERFFEALITSQESPPLGWEFASTVRPIVHRALQLSQSTQSAKPAGHTNNRQLRALRATRDWQLLLHRWAAWLVLFKNSMRVCSAKTEGRQPRPPRTIPSRWPAHRLRNNCRADSVRDVRGGWNHSMLH
mmetsp:Transcript_50959/g.115844  ORF Transcript_50959/g.115844 Transcript_50959/m.115844 type:complete len:226 (-) Transcript_50959:220-897(-)